MPISLFDLFKIGIGPSSSHTVGPMCAANQFVQHLQEKNLLEKCANINIQLYGSLALTGDGHGTLPAILNGLEGDTPQAINPENVVPRATTIIDTQEIHLNKTKPISFDKEKDLQLLMFDKRMKFISPDGRDNNKITFSSSYYCWNFLPKQIIMRELKIPKKV